VQQAVEATSVCGDGGGAAIAELAEICSREEEKKEGEREKEKKDPGNLAAAAAGNLNQF
jgi:hypothetical protein